MNNWEWKAVQAIWITDIANVQKPEVGFVDFEPTLFNSRFLIGWRNQRIEGNFGFENVTTENGYDEKIILEFSALSIVDKEWMKNWSRWVQNRPMAIIVELYDGGMMCLFGVLLSLKFQHVVEIGKSSSIKISGLRTKTREIARVPIISQLLVISNFAMLSQLRVELSSIYSFEHFKIGYSSTIDYKNVSYVEGDEVWLPAGLWYIYAVHKQNSEFFGIASITLSGNTSSSIDNNYIIGDGLTFPDEQIQLGD